MTILAVVFASLYFVEIAKEPEPAPKSTRSVRTRAAVEVKAHAARAVPDERLSYKPKPGDPDAIVVDATVLDKTLFTLTAQGSVEATGLYGHTIDCAVAPPPEKIVYIDVAGGELIARADSGRIFTLSGCSRGAGKWNRVKALSVDGREHEIDSATHLSASPDGVHVWVQVGESGQLYKAGSGVWKESGPRVDLGDASIRRTIGDGREEFVDLFKGIAMRNGRVEQRAEGVESVVYTEKASRPKAVPPGTKRLCEGTTCTFPSALGSVVAKFK